MWLDWRQFEGDFLANDAMGVEECYINSTKYLIAPEARRSRRVYFVGMFELWLYDDDAVRRDQ